DVRVATRRASCPRIRDLRRAGQTSGRDFPHREHGRHRDRRLRTVPHGAERGAGPMTAIILAAGVGKRLAGAAAGRPKCLVDIGGRPLLARLLDAVAGAGVGEVIVVTGFGSDDVQQTIGAGPAGLTVRYLFNARFREGAILSLYTAREALSGAVLVM